MSKQFKDVKKSSRRGNGRSRKGRSAKEDKYKDNDESGTEIGKGPSEYKSKANDASWYALNPALLDGAASFSWLTATGTPWSLSDRPTSSDAFNDVAMDQYSPGIMVLRTTSTPGYSDNYISAVNVAARKFYSWVRHANSGHCSYTAEDLMLYVLAMDEVYSFYAYLVRLYGVINTYSPFNRYYPKAVIEAMGVDYDDILAHISDLLFFINSFADRIGSFSIPASMTYFARHQWMYSGIYTDQPSVKGQIYMYAPHGYRVYIETEGAGKLEWNPISLLGELQTFEDLKTIANKMMDAIALSEDCDIMNGDILKAYGTGGIYKLVPVPVDYKVLPDYNPEVLSQIQNATVFEDITMGSLDITQDVAHQALIFKPQFPSSIVSTVASALCSGRIINMYKDDVKPADTMVATRLTTIATANQDGTMSLKAMGSDICLSAEIYTYQKVKGELTLKKRHFSYMDVFDSAKIADGLTILQEISSFDFHPMFMLFAFQKDSAGKTLWSKVARAFNLNNYVVLKDSDLSKLHDTALLSQLWVPQVGASTK